jgi:DNA repair exonuclease SbcCD ATPase subunit
MSTSVSVNLSTNPELEKLFRERPDLKTGDKLEAKVTQLKQDGQVTLDFGKFEATAKLHIPVKVGDTIQLVVMEKTKQLKLKIEGLELQTPKEARNLVKHVDIKQEQSIQNLYDKINRLLDKELKTPQSSATEKPQTEALKDISKELTQLKQHIEIRETQEPVPKELKQELRELLKNVETTLKELPKADSSQNPETAKQLNTLSKTIRHLRTAMESNRDVVTIKEQVQNEVAQLKTLLEDVQYPDKKEAKAIIDKLTQSADKISQLKTPEQILELRRIVAQEIKLQLSELQDSVKQRLDTTALLPEDRLRFEHIQQRAQNLENAIDITLKSNPPNAKEIQALLDNVQQVVKEVNAPPISQDDPLAKTSFPPPSYIIPSDIQAQHSSPQLQEEIVQELAKLELALEPIGSDQTLPQDIKSRLQHLVDQVEITLKEIPQAHRPETSEPLQTLFREVHTLRASLDIQKDFHELKEAVVKEITRLTALAEELDLPDKKELDTVIKRLMDASDKIQQLKGPEQLQELRQILAQEVKADLTQLSEVISQQIETASPRSPEMQQMTEIRDRADLLQREIDVAMQKLPSSAPVTPDVEVMIKEIESALTKLAELQPIASTATEAPQFSENVQTSYDNIKTALRILQNNLRVSGGRLEIPDEIRVIFENLQSDLKAAEATDSILQQMTQLREMIQKAELPFEKVTHEIVESLTQIIDQITQLKDQSNYQEIRHLVQQRLGPQLKMLGDIMGSAKLLGALEPEHMDSIASIHGAIRELQGGVQHGFTTGETPSQATELTQLTEITDRLASLQAGQVGTAHAETSESIANLSRNIEQLLARLPGDSSAATENSAIPTKIKNLLNTLKSHFEPLDIGQDAMKLVPKLKSIVEDSGIFFEKKISDVISKLSDASTRIQDVSSLNQLSEIRSILANDMKPNLMQLREMLADDQIASQLGDAKTIDSIRNAVDDLLANIGTQQERAIDTKAQDAPMQAFTFHLPIKDEEPAELKVFYNKGREKESPDEFKLSLFLEMSKIGDIRSDFMQLKDDLNISFYVRDEKVKNHFLEHMPELEEALAPIFTNLNINLLISKEKLADFETEEMNQQIISDKAIDVKI